MQVRRFSPTSFWIEMPFSNQTPWLVWRAMSECGLVRGKINSSVTTHLVPAPLGHKYIVQGLTPLGLFSNNVLIQAHLCPSDDGTSIELDAANARGDFDFGTASRLKREYAANLESFFRRAPSDWEQQLEAETSATVAPIASPTAQEMEARPRHEAPEFDVVLPFDHAAPYRQLYLALYVGGLRLAQYLGILGPVALLLCCWKLWAWRQGQKILWWEPVLLAGCCAFELQHQFLHWF